MSGELDVLSLKEDDVSKFLAASTHIGSKQVDFQMESYVFKRTKEGTHIINLKKTWEKLVLAARAIVAIENPGDICVISSRQCGQRAILKFALHTGATPVAGRFTPGTFTNQIQAAFREPRLLVVTDPRVDHQPLTEASYVNIPVIAFCNTDAPLRYVDIAIPCNTKSKISIGLMWWMLAREVLRLRGTISRENPWEIMPDLYFYRDPEEDEKEEMSAMEKEKDILPTPAATTAPDFGPTKEWATEVQLPPSAGMGAAATTYGAPVTEDWSAGGTAEDWAGTAKPASTATTAAAAAAPAVPGPGGPTAPATGGPDWGGQPSEQW